MGDSLIEFLLGRKFVGLLVFIFYTYASHKYLKDVEKALEMLRNWRLTEPIIRREVKIRRPLKKLH